MNHQHFSQRRFYNIDNSIPIMECSQLLISCILFYTSEKPHNKKLNTYMRKWWDRDVIASSVSISLHLLLFPRPAHLIYVDSIETREGPGLLGGEVHITHGNQLVSQLRFVG